MSLMTVACCVLPNMLLDKESVKTIIKYEYRYNKVEKKWQEKETKKQRNRETEKQNKRVRVKETNLLKNILKHEISKNQQQGIPLELKTLM
jgi:lipid A disaccharide synthetase